MNHYTPVALRNSSSHWLMICKHCVGTVRIVKRRCGPVKDNGEWPFESHFCPKKNKWFKIPDVLLMKDVHAIKTDPEDRKIWMHNLADVVLHKHTPVVTKGYYWGGKSASHQGMTRPTDDGSPPQFDRKGQQINKSKMRAQRDDEVSVPKLGNSIVPSAAPTNVVRYFRPQYLNIPHNMSSIKTLNSRSQQSFNSVFQGSQQEL